MVYFLQHAVEALKSEQPPAVHWSKKLDHVVEMGREVVIYDEVDLKIKTGVAVLN